MAEAAAWEGAAWEAGGAQWDQSGNDSYDADLALAIALQEEEEEEEARAMQAVPPPFVGVHTTYKELPIFTVEGVEEAEAEDEAGNEGRGAGLSSENKSCIICLCDFANGDQVRALPCLHRFHVDCIDPWLESSKYCPSCKLSVTTGRMQEETPQRRVVQRARSRPSPAAAMQMSSPAMASPASRASQRSTPTSARRSHLPL